MNRNLLYLKVSGAAVTHDEAYMQQRNSLKKLEGSLAAADAAVKAWIAATVAMNRALWQLADDLGDLSVDISSSEGTGIDAAIESHLKALKGAIATAESDFLPTAQQDVVGQLQQITGEFSACDALRHTRNRAQEQFDVDRLVLEKKIESYHNKGKSLSESKKYVELVAARETSEMALQKADSSYKASFDRLACTLIPTTRRYLIKTFAGASARLTQCLSATLQNLSLAAGGEPPAAKAEGATLEAVSGCDASSNMKGVEVVSTRENQPSTEAGGDATAVPSTSGITPYRFDTATKGTASSDED